MNQVHESTSQPVTVPWRGKELRHFWALVRTNGLSADDVAAITGARNKTSIKELTRSEWLEIIWRLQHRNDPEHGCSDEQWARIKWLQHEIGWTDKHLENYIKKFGHIDHLRWLSTDIARKIMTAMEHIRDYVPKSVSGEQRAVSGKDRETVNRETKGREDE